jgi:hypothetical protein
MKSRAKHRVCVFQWNIEITDKGCYRLRALGALVGEDKGLLWAFLIDREKDYEWVIVPQSNGLYTYVLFNLICATRS